MLNLEAYVESEYNVPEAVCIKTNYSYSSNVAIDKKSNRPIQHHTITMKTIFYDRKANVILSKSIIFKDDNITKAQDKSFRTINGKDLINKFRVAKPEIIMKLIRDSQQKIENEQAIIGKLNEYLGDERDIIAPCMKGIVDVKDDNNTATTKKTKTRFDM